MLTGDQAYILSKEYTDAHGGGSGGTSNYSDLTNKPMINSVTLTGNKTSSDLGLVAAETGKGLSTNDYTDADETKLAGIEAGAQVNVQADWTEADNTSDAYIDHKPTLGTAAAKDSTNAVTDGSVDLVESGAVHSAIAAAISPVQGAVSANTSAISDIKDGTSIDSFGDVETALSGKADVVSSATNGDLAGLDANGNLTDSGIPAANVADHDYVDSGDSAQEALTRASIGWTGKNELPITLDGLKALNTDGTWDGNVYTRRDVTFTFTTNNAGYVTKITVNGTASGHAELKIKTAFHPDAGKYVISRGGEQTSDVQLYVNLYNGDTIVRQVTNLTTTNSYEFTIDYLDYDRIVMGAWVNSGKTASNIEIYPMLCDTRIKDSTFEPYHESVEECKCDNSVIAPVENETTASKAYVVGNHFVRNGAYCLVTAAIASGATLTEGANYVASSVGEAEHVCRITYNGDCDALGPGIVYYGNSGSHTPFNWAIINTYYANQGGDNRVQVAYSSVTASIAIRQYGGGAWSAWKNVTLS